MTKLYDRKYYDQGLFAVPPILWTTLRELPPQQVAERAQVTFDDGKQGYETVFLSRPYFVDPWKETISSCEEVLSADNHFQLYLVLLTYLAQAPEEQPTGKMISEKQLPGGVTFFRGVHALGTHPLTKVYGNDPEGFRKLGEAYGAVEEKFGDVSFLLHVLPKIPVRFIFYAEDDEFPASMKIMFDSTIATIFKQLDGVWAVFNLAVEHLLLPPPPEGAGP